MSSNENQDKKIDTFITSVARIFQFLEIEYGYVRSDPEFHYYAHTQYVLYTHITYLSDTIGVRISWNREDAWLTVTILELERGAIPEKYSYHGRIGDARAIKLEDLVAIITGETVKDPLPESPPMSRYSNKFHKQREKRIEEDMAGVLQTYASWLQEYASNILHGETSIFPAVQRYSRKRLEQEYEAYGRAFPKEQYED